MMRSSESAGVAAIASAAAQALVDHTGEGKDIGALVDRAGLDIELLGRHVADGAAA